MCIRWRDRSRDLCRAIEVDGDGRYRKVTEDRGGDRKVVVTYRRFTDGNPAGL